MMGLEEEFGISVEEKSGQTITTVQEAADMIDKLLETEASTSKEEALHVKMVNIVRLEREILTGNTNPKVCVVRNIKYVFILNFKFEPTPVYHLVSQPFS